LQGSGPLNITFTGRISIDLDTEGGTTTPSAPIFSTSPEVIFGRGNTYTVLQPANQVPLTSQETSAILGQLFPPADNTKVMTMLEPKLLRRPFFYQDNQHTFFVEPTLTETTLGDWEAYWNKAKPAANQSRPQGTRGVLEDVGNGSAPDALVSNLQALSALPSEEPLALFQVQPNQDRRFTLDMTILYDTSLVGASGRIDETAQARSTEGPSNMRSFTARGPKR
jgi:hypothetical protein